MRPGDYYPSPGKVGSFLADSQRVPHISPRFLRGDVGNADLDPCPPIVQQRSLNQLRFPSWSLEFHRVRNHVRILQPGPSIKQTPHDQ